MNTRAATISQSHTPPALSGVWNFMLRDLRGSSAMRSLWVFCACLFLGITLIAACGGLLQMVREGLSNQERLLFGGDLQISDRQALTPDALNWIEANGEVSRLLELRTMLGTEQGGFTAVELQSVDDAYPLYGKVTLAPDVSLANATRQGDDGLWGAAFDPVLAEQLELEVGQRVNIGSIELELRALIVEQPDRSLRADVRGPPLIVDEGALQASGLLQPNSLVDYDYRVRITEEPSLWRSRLRNAFPDAEWEVQSVEERGEFIGQRLDQVASVLLLIGFTTLLIGGLGVSNSVNAYLQTKLRTLATLQSLGAREQQITWIYVGQIIVLALLASTLGALVGSSIAWLAGQSLSARLPLAATASSLMFPTLVAILFGVFIALAFALPGLGRTLGLRPALLLRGLDVKGAELSKGFRIATFIMLGLCMGIVMLMVPEPVIGISFILCIAALLWLLDRIVIVVQNVSRQLGQNRLLDTRFSLRMGLASLYRPGASLRAMLLSLGTALTLLVASSQVIKATSDALSETVPGNSPSLVFYDIQSPQVAEFRTLLSEQPGHVDTTLVPLVLGRLTHVNDEDLSKSTDAKRALEANDEHKLSYRSSSIDNTTVDRGAFWADDYTGPPLFAMEDREADQLGLMVGDRLRFSMPGDPLEAELAAIYSQARFQTRFWLEGVFTPGALEPYISRHIGSAAFDPDTEIAAMSALGDAFPNVVTIRTAKIIEAARSVLANASLAMILIGSISLAASILVMASVVAVNRQRQVYESTIMHAVGARMSTISKALLFEYAVLALILTVFASLVGSGIAALLLTNWLKLPVSSVIGTGVLVAATASTACLLAGALWLLRTLTLAPSSLLRRGA